MASLQQPAAQPAKPATADDFQAELRKATEYWGTAYAKDPRDPKAALSYARNLKALGEKRQALAVLQQSAVFNGNNREIIGEYGRLALDLDQVSVAHKLLEQADDPARPDWRIVSARGTVLAKQGRYHDAIPFYERALTLAPNQASVLNNLALAYAMEGNPEKGEPLLKKAAAAGGGHDAQVHQNLAIVLGLQGKYDEAKQSTANHLPVDNATSDIDYVKRMVRLDPKPLPEGQVPAGTAASARPSTTASLPDKKSTKKPAKQQATDTASVEPSPPTSTPVEEPPPTTAPKGAAADDRAEEVPASWATQVSTPKKTARR